MEDPKSGCRFLVDSSCIPSWEHDEKCLQKNNFAKTRETFITCKTCPKESAPSLNMKNLELTVRGAKCLVKGHSPHSSSDSCNSQVLKFDFSEIEQELGSSGQNTSGPEICPSNSSYYSGLSETDTPLALSRNRRFHSRSNSGISSLLPSDSCKYLTWQKVEQHDIRGSQLHCPRVREGPSEEELLFQQARHNLPPKKRVLEKNKWETWLQENWEDCKVLNISFQDLGDPYQVENFNRILRRLIRVETLWLVDNSLVDLSAIRLPSCRTLNLNRNYLTSFKQLPKLPQIQHLSLAENHIETLAGLPSLQSTPLESLILKRNPCEFHQNYRKCVFSCLPNLKMLDGISKLPEDFSPPEPNIFSKLCIVT